jgi:hypothetical protein
MQYAGCLRRARFKSPVRGAPLREDSSQFGTGYTRVEEEQVYLVQYALLNKYIHNTFSSCVLINFCMHRLLQIGCLPYWSWSFQHVSVRHAYIVQALEVVIEQRCKQH